MEPALRRASGLNRITYPAAPLLLPSGIKQPFYYFSSQHTPSSNYLCRFTSLSWPPTNSLLAALSPTAFPSPKNLSLQVWTTRGGIPSFDPATVSPSIAVDRIQNHANPALLRRVHRNPQRNRSNGWSARRLGWLRSSGTRLHRGGQAQRSASRPQQSSVLSQELRGPWPVGHMSIKSLNDPLGLTPFAQQRSSYLARIVGYELPQTV